MKRSRRTSRVWIRALSLASFGVATGALISLPGCSGDSESSTDQALTQSVAELEGATLAATVDTPSLSTVDRLTVELRATAPSGMVVRSLDFDPEPAGWTLVSESEPRTGLDDTGRVWQATQIVLEPFLDGEYQIPPVSASFALPGETDTLRLATTPIAVTVESVLTEDAVLDVLAPTAGAIDPPTNQAPTRSPLIIPGIVVFVALASVVVLLGVRKRLTRQPDPDPVTELRLLRAHRAPNPETDRDRLAMILHRARLSHPGSGIDSQLDRLNTARYAPADRAPAGSVDAGLIREEIDSALRSLEAAR